VRTTGDIKIAGDPGTTYMHYASSALRLVVGGTERLNLTSTKLAVTGSRGGNAALASLLTQLAAMNLITDSSTA